jgi:EmrB/QacA subfamily drug resistance transporter
MGTRGSILPTFLIAGVATFMAALDNLVVATALPTIRDEFHTTLESLEWTVNAYTLTFAVLLLTAAILGDRYGRRAVFVGGIALFTLGSALAAMSGSAGMLVAARAVQGIGGSVIFPLGLTLVVQAVSPQRRGVAIAALSGTAGIGIALGPLIGGLVVEYGNWHWIFWLNVPLGVLLIPLALRWLRESHGPYTRLDVRGAVLVTAGILGVVFGLVRSSALGWGDAQVIGAVLLGLVLLAGFVAWEQRADSPVVPPHLFRRRGFTLSNLVALLTQGGVFGSTFLLVQYLQNVLHYAPMSAGLRTLPWTVMPVFVAPVAAIFGERLGIRRLVVGSALLQAVALAWLAVAVSPTVPYLVLLPGLVLGGAGMGLFLALSARQTLDFVSPAEEGVASGVNNAMRQVGVVLGVATLAGIFAGSGGGYDTVQHFVHGLRPALWVGTVALLGAVLAAALTPSRPHTASAAAARDVGIEGGDEPAVAGSPVPSPAT